MSNRRRRNRKEDTQRDTNTTADTDDRRAISERTDETPDERTERDGAETVVEFHGSDPQETSRTLPAVRTVDSGTVPIESEDDILTARQTARDVAEAIGFRITDVTRTVTAVSELARNVYLYAGTGRMHWREIRTDRTTGIELEFEDDGPGIRHLEEAVNGNHSTSNGMGRGLQGTRELMDAFMIETAASGTTVTIRKWNR